MTRQERITEIGKFKPSIFSLNGKDISKNHMSYFIIPFAHELYAKKSPQKVMNSFASLQWEVLNNQSERILSQSGDGRFMSSIKRYLYDEMIPKYTNIEEHFVVQKNLIFKKTDIAKEWTFSSYFRGELEYETEFLITGIDLLIVDEHIAFFTLKTELTLANDSTISEISSKFNRNMRDFRAMYIDEVTQTFSNDSKKGISVFAWLSSLVSMDGESLLCVSEKSLVDIQNREEYYPVFNASYNAKMITAMHIDEMYVLGEEIEPAFEDDLITMNIDGTSSIEEVPYLLATTSELYPTKAWEGNEEYINGQIGNGEINIWKYWSGVALHDSMAFFSIGDGGSAIVNSAKNSYYFIYMLNLYSAYRMRFFEHELIDNEFVSIENIRPLFSDIQRLKNQYMCTELSSLFQPNVVHEAIKGAMKTDDMYDEVRGNIEATLEITSYNTDIIITVLVSILSVAGMYFNQDMLMDFVEKHSTLALISAVFAIGIIAYGAKNRSSVIKLIKKLRTKFAVIKRKFN